MLGGDVTILILLQLQINEPYLALMTDYNDVMILPSIKPSQSQTSTNKTPLFSFAMFQLVLYMFKKEKKYTHISFTEPSKTD